MVSIRVEDRFVHVAAPVDDIDESLSALRLGFAGAIPVVAAVLAGLTWWLVGETLRPGRVDPTRGHGDDGGEPPPARAGARRSRRDPPPRVDDDRARQAPALGVDLDDVVLREVRRLRAGLRAGVVVDTAAVSGAQVHGDSAELARLVRNLLDNAARHAVSVVEVSLYERAGMATLAVADDGPGIAPDQRELVFERFGRVDGARSRDAGGSGLGLATCRAIVERHRGTIGIDAEHRRGARFVVRIPAAP